MMTGDPLREHGIRVFEEGKNIIFSPFSLVELSLLWRSKKLEIQDWEEFSAALSDLMVSKEVHLISDKPSYHYQAVLLEKQYNLTFFDSLHAAVAKIKGETLVSFDKSYDRLAGSGVKRIDPREL